VKFILIPGQRYETNIDMNQRRTRLVIVEDVPGVIRHGPEPHAKDKRGSVNRQAISKGRCIIACSREVVSGQ
jgi:hypothetical protein